MLSKPVRLSLEVISELDKLRPIYPSKIHKLYPGSYSDIILKLLRSHRELAKIEQKAMSMDKSTSQPRKLNHKPIRANKHSSKKHLASIMLYCFNCNVQTPHKKTSSKNNFEYACSICGSRRNV